MEILYYNQDEFLKTAATVASHKNLEDFNYYYHILDPNDIHFSHLKVTEPKKLKNLSEMKELQSFFKIIGLIYDHQEKENYLGYTESKYPRTSFSHQLKEVGMEDRLTFISIYFQELDSLIKKGHKHHIVFPNLFSKNSIIYDVKEETLHLSGIDTLQVEDYSSTLINPAFHDPRILDRIYNSIKYYDDEQQLFRPSFDQFNLMNQFFMYAIGVNLSKELIEREEFGTTMNETMKRLLNQYGLGNEKELYDYLKRVYSFEENRYDLPDAYPYIEKLESNYQLDSNSHFVKRKRLFM